VNAPALNLGGGIHLATALTIRSGLNWFVTYGKRQFDAAIAAGLRAESSS
jgi:hypothetical protein